ncbi:SPO22-domain-containing protein [Delitschia confertaspora ATCC 74209]|uniref:Protein ZIP4 homolog n=1 Tax=Delitschia confertaspora ATCC 74209 TaxID=1513339 RepID=A0A9P4JHE1_9PLEO|nr:SPO22-domain-containing protein [Delitschia confertaspora ATCC 74209]
MALLNSSRREREKKLKSLISFASSLTNRLTSSPTDHSLVEDLQNHVRTLPLQLSSMPIAKREELDAMGTELWNLSTRLRRDVQNQTGGAEEELIRNKVLCLLRLFAFLILDNCGRPATKSGDGKNCIRLMKIALKTARVCLDGKELENATKALERAADYQELLANLKDECKEQEDDVVGPLVMEYFALRTALAWRQDRMDTAEHMFSKIKQLHKKLEPSAAESLADLLYEMGKDFLKKGSYELAIRWLERAYDVLGEQHIEKLSPDAGELKLSIIQGLIQAYIKIGSIEGRQKAWELVKLMETDYTGNMIVPLLKLELLSTSDQFDTGQYSGALLQMIRSVVPTEVNFKMIMHHIHKLKERSNDAACRLLDDFLNLRLFSLDNQDWIQKTIITRIWATPDSSDVDEVIQFLEDLFNNAIRKMKNPLTVSATHAAQTLLWKRVELAYSREQYRPAESWCHLSLHLLFEKAGELNKAKIARKMILCATARRDEAAAREAFSKMSDAGKNDPTTRYLMYKLAINNNDYDLAAECLDQVFRHSSKDATLLYACVLEAQSAGDKHLAIQALENVLVKYEQSATPGVHLPAILRSTIRLLVQEVTKDGSLNPEAVDELCRIFEGAANHAKASLRRPISSTQQLFTAQEFEWFSKNAYNLSLKYCTEMHPQNLTRLLTVCIQFINLLKGPTESEHHGDLPLRLMFCEFLAACAYTTLARAEDNIQASLQYYTAVRRHGQAFRRTTNEQIQAEKLGDSAKSDAISKYVSVVKLELEAAMKLHDWDGLDGLLDECWKYENPDHLDTLADLVLVIHSCLVKANVVDKYQAKTFAVLQKIINISWRQGNQVILKLSRWIRCLFQLALTFDESISMKCVDQATGIATVRQGVSFPCLMTYAANHYPPTELEWLATTSFNHAVDYYIAEDDSKCKLWAEKALRLAECAEDGGGLRDLLAEKYSGLVWK